MREKFSHFIAEGEKMSKEKREMAKKAHEHLKEAKESSREAEKIFRVVGDPDGERFARDAAKAAQDGEEHVIKKLGRD
jgi:hypothetical protein